jgi:hydrogenase maturation factor
MRPGKLPPETLKYLIERYTSLENDVIVGAGVGEDSVAISFGERILLLKTDPITYVTEEIGWYAVIINANDIYAMGGKPKWFLATVLLPTDISEEMIERIFSQISETCKSMEISYCGGHTEISPDLTKPVVVGLMAGTTDKVVSTAGAQEGDGIVLTKGIAIEGTVAIAMAKRSEIGEELFERAMGLKSLLNVRKEAEIASSFNVHAMHDPTEGGLAMALHEISIASRKQIRIWEDAIKIFHETDEICRKFNLNPLGLIASGCLLIVLPLSEVESLIESLLKEGIDASLIGRVYKGSGVRILTKDEFRDLEMFVSDEIIKILDG